MCTAREAPPRRTDIEGGATAAAAVVEPGPGVTDPSLERPPRQSSWTRYTQRLRYWLVGSKREAKVAPATFELQRATTAPASPAQAAVNLDSLEIAQGGEDATPAGKRDTHCLGRLLLMYSVALDKQPLVTKSISSGIIGLLGDLLAQIVEHTFKDAPAPWESKAAVWRSCAVMLDGLLINGPLLHYAYDILENYMPTGESVWPAVMQVAVDVFVIDPVFAFIFVWSTGLIEGRSVRAEILGVIVHEYPTMVLWLVLIGLCWAPLQIYLFNRYPVQFRVLTADLIDLVWTCVASFFSHV